MDRIFKVYNPDFFAISKLAFKILSNIITGVTIFKKYG